MQLTPIPDFSGDGKKHSIAQIMQQQGVAVPDPALVRAISFRINGPGNSQTYSRIGDATVSANTGVPFNNTDDLVLPYAAGPMFGSSPVWDLHATWIYTATGEIISIALVS